MTSATPHSETPAQTAPVASLTGLPDAAAAGPTHWNPAQRIAFRFAFAYILIYFPLPLSTFPGLGWIDSLYRGLWDAITPWVGQHVLGMTEPLSSAQTGSGDKAADYVGTFAGLVLSVLVTAAWSALDRRRLQYTKAHDVLRTYVRYALAITMLSYGFAKVFPTQFPFPNSDRMLQPLGEFSPMGLLWTFMGFSREYTFFGGSLEVLGGVLLLFRRTTTLGALVVVGVMANVVALNFFYDVPVKLYSSHLVLLGVFLLILDLRRLANLLVLNRPTEAAILRMPFSLPRSVALAGRLLKAIILGWLLYSFVSDKVETTAEYGPGATRPPLYGLYEVESFSRDGTLLPPLLSDTTRWKSLNVTRYKSVQLRMMDNSRQRFGLTVDTDQKTFTLSTGGKDSPGFALTYSQPDPEHLVLQGKLQDGVVDVRLKKLDETKFPLVSRGFHWVQETPYNR